MLGLTGPMTGPNRGPSVNMDIATARSRSANMSPIEPAPIASGAEPPRPATATGEYRIDQKMFLRTQETEDNQGSNVGGPRGGKVEDQEKDVAAM